jgi:putative sigma-54 modulation protein
MTVNIQSVNFKADSKLLRFIEERLEKTKLFFDKTINTDVFLKVDNNHERENKIVEMRMSIPGNEIVVTKERKSFEEAADLVVEVLIRQLKKHKEKKK